VDGLQEPRFVDGFGDKVFSPDSLYEGILTPGISGANAVRKITGMCCVEGSTLIFSYTSSPDLSGITRSRRIKSG